MNKPISKMTYEEIVKKVLEVKGIRVSPDGTGMAYVAVSEDGTRIANPSSSEKIVIYRALLGGGF